MSTKTVIAILATTAVIVSAQEPKTPPVDPGAGPASELTHIKIVTTTKEGVTGPEVSSWFRQFKAIPTCLQTGNGMGSTYSKNGQVPHYQYSWLGKKTAKCDDLAAWKKALPDTLFTDITMTEEAVTETCAAKEDLCGRGCPHTECFRGQRCLDSSECLADNCNDSKPEKWVCASSALSATFAVVAAAAVGLMF